MSSSSLLRKSHIAKAFQDLWISIVSVSGLKYRTGTTVPLLTTRYRYYSRSYIRIVKPVVKYCTIVATHLTYGKTYDTIRTHHTPHTGTCTCWYRQRKSEQIEHEKKGAQRGRKIAETRQSTTP
jgi:hypothetical protein